MTPKRICLVVLGAAAISIVTPPWKIHDSLTYLTLGLTLSGVIGLYVTPGLILLWYCRERAPAKAIHLIWVAVSGPLVLAAIGLTAWLAGDLWAPRLICRGAALLLIGSGLVWTLRQPADLRLSAHESRALLIALLLVLVASGRSIHSLGVQGELYRGTVTRTLAADGRSDTRVPFLIPINVENHWNPFAPESQAFYSPYTFTSRGPLVGLAATPAVLIWARTPMRTIGQMDRPFDPIDRYGYMQYRFSVIVFSALAVIPFFVALDGTQLALAGTAIYALSPFVIHEVYFTWTKQATVPLVLSAFCLVMARHPGSAGLLTGFAYLAHPSAAFAGLALVPLLVGIRRDPDWSFSCSRILRFSSWWHGRRDVAIFAIGAASVLVLWFIYSYDKPNPAGFLSYAHQADGRQAESIQQWLSSRVHSLASTLVPLYSPLMFSSHPSLLPVFERPLGIVTFFTQYFYTLPAGVGFAWFVWRFRQLGRSLRRGKGVAVVMIGLPTVGFWIQWGATVTGLLREGLHIPLAFLMLVWLRFTPVADLSHRPLHIARAIELLIFIWLPTIVSHRAVVNRRLLATDLLGLCVTITAVILLTAFIHEPGPPNARQAATSK
jgi:hypothetical protein